MESASAATVPPWLWATTTWLDCGYSAMDALIWFKRALAAALRSTAEFRPDQSSSRSTTGASEAPTMAALTGEPSSNQAFTLPDEPHNPWGHVPCTRCRMTGLVVSLTPSLSIMIRRLTDSLSAIKQRESDAALCAHPSASDRSGNSVRQMPVCILEAPSSHKAKRPVRPSLVGTVGFLSGMGPRGSEW